jgi:hypothetical protein
MSNLVSSVQAAIEQYVDSKKESHTKVDVLRVLRDQSALLYERQVVLDALTQDPLKQLEEYPSQIQRIQKLLRVISCHRIVTHEGLSQIEAMVQLDKDELMASVVDQHLQLTFRYDRRPTRPEDVPDQSLPYNGTHISYSIELSKDFGERRRLLIVECWAAGDAPCIEPAQPIDSWEDMDDEEEGDAMDASKEDYDDNEKTTMDATKEDDADGPLEKSGETPVDKFAAYMDPDVVEDLSRWSGLSMEEAPLFFLLMTFPFWEQEWDLIGFVWQVVFADDDDDEVVEFDEEGEEVT